MLVRRDSKWIYDTLAEAFNRESAQPWESYSRIELKPISGAERLDRLGPAAMLLEVDYIEFEVESETG